jgi:hypothetical protein
MYVKGATYCTYEIKCGDQVLVSGESNGTQNKGYYEFRIGKFVTKHGHKDVYVVAKFYAEKGAEEPITIITDSMAQYVVRAKAAGTADGTLLDAMMKYVTAAWNHFGK